MSNADLTSLSVSKGISLVISGPKKQKLHVSMDLEQPPKVKSVYARVSSRVPFLYLKNKLAFLSGRMTSSSDLALSRNSSVQRSFFCGDVIAIMSWAPDVVNLVRPQLQRCRSE